MTTREKIIHTLKQYRPIHLECERLRLRIIDKRGDMYSIRAVCTSSAAVKSGSISDRVESVVEAMDSMIHYYADKMAAAESAEKDIMGLINQITDSEKRNVLFMHYIEGKTFFEISEIMIYSERSIWNRHNAALEELCNKYPDHSDS